MSRAFACIFLVAGLAGGAFAQTAFEAAEVHVSAKSPNAYMTTAIRGGRYEIRKATMVDLIRVAWGIDSYRVSGGPGWLELERFDVIAQAPVSTTPEELHEMLKALLGERFHLAVHDDTKAIPTFFLTVGKGKKNMKEGDAAGGPPGCQSMPQGPSEPGAVPWDTLNCHNATMNDFIGALRYPASPYLGVGPVLDKTGIEGGWNFNIKWTRRALLPQAGSDGLTIFDAVDKQLGLKLESQNAPTPVVVVDRVDRKPTENPAGVSERLLPGPARPTEFEVADVRPTGPGVRGGAFRVEPNGRVELRGITMQNLITLAWEIDPDMIVGAPKWLNADRFDVIAKAPAEGEATPGKKVEDIDFETIQVMMRALLKERFKLTVHNDVQPVNVYALIASKSETKMKKADEANRASCKYSPELLPAKTALTNIYSCQNTTIGDFAEKLRGWAPAYFDRPVVDLTGVDGSFDFTLGWTGKGRIQTGPARGGDAGQPGGLVVPSDPSGGITVFEAVDRQLGLKLEARKHPMPVLVIDHVEQKPTDN
jgi:uncharacterized protein (TIGR03435 family)